MIGLFLIKIIFYQPALDKTRALFEILREAGSLTESIPKLLYFFIYIHFPLNLNEWINLTTKKISLTTFFPLTFRHKLRTKEQPTSLLQPSQRPLILQPRTKLSPSPLMSRRTRVMIQIWKKKREQQQKMLIPTMELKVRELKVLMEQLFDFVFFLRVAFVFVRTDD